ncbi:hypothetical protein KZX46_02750 (plasmid) [Polymorphobacter sp. PAMC 29334]|uniref:hypothetical protein n=1 Tax=Polymorphobacter sp. PAMC 29334 TaxID=2862331 RepID=UPI001C790CCD|nr:hypothetical protein [Polymorphobacter sp. PAMC 29334]QYE33064.1 hypothetical protein KZX46_02750 [Polymorphobacter sp. PAMC 29334]
MFQSPPGKILTVETVGALKLMTADGCDVTPRGRKARALILYLLRKPGHIEARKVLITLLWGDRGDEQARQSLRQTLYELRPLMGTAHPLVAADRVSVWLDTSCLAVASQNCSGATAASVTSTDLDGISPGFDRWLVSERQSQSHVEATKDDRARIAPITVASSALSPLTAARRWRVAFPLAASLAALVSIALVHSRSDAPEDHRRLIVVQPLRVTPGDLPARRLSQDLASDLSRAVLGHDGALEFADDRIASRRAAFSVSGNVASGGGDLHAVVVVSDSTDNAILWSHDYTAPLADMAGFRQQVSTNVAAVLVCALGTRGVPEAVDARATALYLEACNLHSGDQSQVAFLLRQVTARVPQFAGAWADLAISLAYAREDAGPANAEAMRREAEGAARRALAIDPHEGNAYYAQALLLPGIEHWIPREKLIEAGLKVEPDNAQLYNRYAIDLGAIGRVQDSIAANQRAVALDPLFPGKTARLVRALANAGELDAANEAINHMRETWPDDANTWHARFATAARFGDPREALAMLNDRNETVGNKDDMASWRTFLRARASPTQANIDYAVAALVEERRRGFTSDVQLVSDFALLGRPATALDIALQMPPQQESDFWFRKILQSVRADPRFMRVVQRQGLLAIWRTTNLWPDFCRDGSVPYDCRQTAERFSWERSHAAA